MVGNISTDLLIRHTYDLLELIAKGEYKPVETEPEINPENSDAVSEPLPSNDQEVASVDQEAGSE